MRLTALSLALFLPASLSAQVDFAGWSDIQARSIGPAGMSGRVTAIDAVVGDPNIVYVGTATGGVWKTTNGGLTWMPVFDDQPVSSIGAVAVFQANPDVVWIGTGEGNPRNSAGVGRGVYKSVDGGRTWTLLGLTQSERIHRIALHPSDPDVAYLGVLGPSWSDGEQRGVYKTTDGGTTWERILFVNERTGASDLVMDPSNPNKLYVGMWEHRRLPWFFESGGEGSGVYVTHDGGSTWQRYGPDDGMPSGDLGRIGLAVAPNDPRVVYALVEAKSSAMLRSNDAGVSWETIASGEGVAPRPFYYADIRLDPENENRVYNLHSRITVSEDQGRTFRTVVPTAKVHGDVHELWIHPEDGRFLIMGNDGGVAFSRDRGATWRFVENLPLAQFYHLNVDMDRPFNVYGGLQDNGSWFGPSATWVDGPIRNYYWRRVGSGDGFATLNDFGDARYGYSLSQQGFLRRFDKLTGERKDVRPVHPDGTALRFNWNAALNVDPLDSSTIYLGSQFVHRSRDAGMSWDIISPDLTTNDPEKQRAMESGGITRDASGAENHTTILTIAPSPVEPGVIWVGTDDGNVQISRDGGATWTNVVDRIADVPATTWVPHIEPSKYVGGTAFVVFDDHRRGNWNSYVFKTVDYGRSWASLVTDEIDGFVHVVEQDPVEPDLLFLGTEFGLFVSVDGGNHWSQWSHGLPPVPVRAIVVHPRDHGLALGTHGRGVYILDDIRPLRAVASNPDLMGLGVHLFEIPPTYQHRRAEASTWGYRSSGDAMFAGENRDYGAMVTYAVGETNGKRRTNVTITDADGQKVRTISASSEAGVHRITWDLRRDGYPAPDRNGGDTLTGPQVLPGTYTVRVGLGDQSETGQLTVHPDPRITITDADRKTKFAAIERVGQLLSVSAELLSRIRKTDDALETAQDALRTRGDSASSALARGTQPLLDEFGKIESHVVATPGAGLQNTRDLLGSRLRSLYNSLQTSWDAPTNSQRTALAQVEETLSRILGEWNDLSTSRLTDHARRLQAARLDVLPSIEPLTLDWKPPAPQTP